MKFSESQKYRFKIYFIALFITAGVVAVIKIITSKTGIQISESDGDLLNWVTLVIEIGIGVFVAISIQMFGNIQQEKMSSLLQKTKNQQDEVTDLVTKIKEIETKQQKMIEGLHSFLKNERQRIERWKQDFGDIILADLEGIVQMYGVLEKWLSEYKNKPSPQQKSDIILSAVKLGDIIELHIQNIKHYLPKIENYFDDPSLGVQVVGVSEQSPTIFHSLHQGYHWDQDLETTFNIIRNQKTALIGITERVKKEIPVQTGN